MGESTQAERDLDLFLKSEDESASEAILARLITNTIEPVASRIIRYRLATGGSSAAGEIEDLVSDTVLDALRRLRAWKSAPDGDPIRSLDGFAAILAHRKCTDYFRRRHPERWRLKTRLRYVLTQHPELSAWEDANAEFVAGFSKWKGQPAGSIDEDAIMQTAELHKTASSGSLLNTVLVLFRVCGKPLPMDSVVSISARLLGIQDSPMAHPDRLQEFPSTDTPALTTMEQHSYLKSLWQEIQQLPERQSAALLLSLRDNEGSPLLPLLPSAGIASFQNLAQLLHLSEDVFRDLWNKLPLADDSIGALLGLTRQQVINLRKSARERLSRRLKGKRLMMEHLTQQQIEGFQRRNLAPAEAEAVALHLQECDACRDLVMKSPAFQKGFDSLRSQLQSEDHPAFEELAEFVNGIRDHEWIQEHLQDCRDCSMQVEDMRDARKEPVAPLQFKERRFPPCIAAF